MHEAQLYTVEYGGNVSCRLCNHFCRIPNGGNGICGVRKNVDGKLFASTYGAIIAGNNDPVEKKPLFHFLPGSYSYSIASAGCNFRCSFCQNWEISQKNEFDRLNFHAAHLVSPEKIVQDAETCGCKSISFTYTEPTLSFEFIKDTGKIAREKGLKCIMVSNGFMSAEALDGLNGVISAYNIDLKSFSDDFYRKYCNGRLQPVLENLKNIHASGAWLEITTLLIPDLNDSPEEIRDIAAFIASIDSRIPWHISRFFPRYQLQNHRVTNGSSIRHAIATAHEHALKFVYSGNCEESTSTVCTHCNGTLIQRTGYFVQKLISDDGTCPGCGHREYGVWK